MFLQYSNFFEQAPLQFLQGCREIHLAYKHFVHTDMPERKLMILISGRAENILKWVALAQDFFQQGYDVLMFDHRGQGYSQRLQKDAQKGDLDRFEFFVQDMDKIIQKITALFAYSHQYIVAHSMGGLISAYYLAHCDHQIRRAVLSSPCFELPLKHPIRDELIVAAMLLFGQGGRYVLGKGAYEPRDPAHNPISHSSEQVQAMNAICQQYPILQLGGPTYRWVHFCLAATKRLPKILPKIKIPVLLLQAGDDEIVENKNLSKLTALLPQSELAIIPNAKHEILFEIDELRQQALTQIQNFFNSVSL